MVFPDEIKTRQVATCKTLGVDFPRVFCRGRELSRGGPVLPMCKPNLFLQDLTLAV